MTTVSEARINSYNERPEGVEAALWIPNVPRDATRAGSRFNQLADIPAIYAAESRIQPLQRLAGYNANGIPPSH